VNWEDRPFKTEGAFCSVQEVTPMELASRDAVGNLLEIPKQTGQLSFY